MLLALPIISACNNNDIEETSSDQVSLQISMKDCLTRSVITSSSLPEDSELGIFVADESNSVSYANVNGVVKSDYCLLSTNIPLGSDKRYVYAYYPYSSSNTTATAIPFTVTSSQTDYLMGYSDDGNGLQDYVDSSKPTANMMLQHALARVTLRIKKSADNTNSGQLSAVALDSVAIAGSVNLLRQISTGTTIGRMSISTGISLSASEESAVDVLVAPTSSLTYTTLLMTVDGATYSVNIPTSKVTEWEAGKQYVYSVEVGENANVRISNPDIVTWSNNMQEEIVITKALQIRTAIEGTRSVVTGSSFAEGDELGLFAYNANGEPYDSVNVCSNVQTTLDNSIWKCSPKIKLTSEKATIYGYYPYQGNAIISGNSIKVDVNPDWKIGQRDYMYSGGVEADSIHYNPMLTFKHALARITLAVTKSSRDNGDGVITSVEIANGETNGVRGTEFAETGWMNLANGTIARIENSDDNLVIGVNETATTSSTANIELLVLPNQSKAEASRTADPVVVTLTIDGTPHSFTIANPQWYAGEQYTYPITLDRR